jgi:MFS family permease
MVAGTSSCRIAWLLGVLSVRIPVSCANKVFPVAMNQHLQQWRSPLPVTEKAPAASAPCSWNTAAWCMIQECTFMNISSFRAILVDRVENHFPTKVSGTLPFGAVCDGGVLDRKCVCFWSDEITTSSLEFFVRSDFIRCISLFEFQNASSLSHSPSNDSLLFCALALDSHSLTSATGLMAEPIIDIAPDQIFLRSEEPTKPANDEEKKYPDTEPIDKTYLKFNAIGTALGFLVNGYMYQVGTLLLTLYVDAYHTVFVSSFLQSALSTSVLYGVLFGLIGFGFFADYVGRKAGLIACSCIVIFGSILSTAANGKTTDGMFWMIIVGRAVVGLGMGGEYTCNVPNIVEDSEEVSTKTRGRRVSLLVMLMEVIGNNTPTLIQLILVAAACRHAYIDSSAATGVSLPNCRPQIVWRISYALGLIPCLAVLLLRVRMRNSKLYQTDEKLRKKSYDLLDLFIILRHYSSRMVGTIFMWFLIDWINYSQGTFGGVILSSVIGASLFKTAWIGLAQGVVLIAGPVTASLVVDRLGRRTTEVLGWLWLASTQLITAGVYLMLAKHAVGYVIWTTFVFIFQYFVFIPVYLVPAEVYPTRIRATLYGWSSALGKVGGIVGTTVFPYMWRGLAPNHSETGHGGLVGLRRIQWFYAGIEYIGFIMAFLFVPEYSNVSLRGEENRYLGLRARYAARFAKQVDAHPVPESGNFPENRHSWWSLLYTRVFRTREAFVQARIEYAQMLLARCYITTEEQLEQYSRAPIYYNDRTLFSFLVRRWRLGADGARTYDCMAESMGAELVGQYDISQTESKLPFWKEGSSSEDQNSNEEEDPSTLAARNSS